MEWLKCRARARSWKQEVQLVVEEMRRSIEYCHWKEGWWERRRTKHMAICPYVNKGLTAYAVMRAREESTRAKVWSEKWKTIQTRMHEVLTMLNGSVEGQEVISVLPELIVELNDELPDDADIVEDFDILDADPEAEH